MSTEIQQNASRLVVTSALGSLLRERAISQKRLAQTAGLRETVINRIKNRRIVQRIDCRVAVRICAILSPLPKAKDGKKTRIGLDALFPIRKSPR